MSEATYTLNICPYRRPFSVPMRSARGHWFEREGILVRLEDPGGRKGYGEVAPLPEFGSETIEAALQFLSPLNGLQVTDHSLRESVPMDLPATRFALASAHWMLHEPDVPYRLPNTVLLPSGETAFKSLEALADQPYRCFKLKIGTRSVNEELSLVNGLLERLPPHSSLRLDANGSLASSELETWLSAYEGEPRIEFIEQPLRPGSEALMRAKSERFGLPIALDESVASPGQLESYTGPRGWSGPIVLKLSILGDPATVTECAARHPYPLIPSSAFETGIGLHACLRLATRLIPRTAVGFGTIAFFEDPLNLFEMSPWLDGEAIGTGQLDSLWSECCRYFAIA